MSVAITDLGNDLQFTFSNGHVYTLNKIDLKIKQDDNFVYLTNGAGFINTAENKVIKLAASEISSPVYADNDALVLGIVALAGSIGLGGGGASAGGGASVWSTKQGDFTAAVTASTKNITITGLGWTVEAQNVAIVEKWDSSGDYSLLKTTNVVVAGNVITLGDIIDDFAAGDTVAVTLIGQDKAYDGDLDSQLNSVQNPENAHYTDEEKLVDEEDQADGTISRNIIDLKSYWGGSIQVRIASGAAADTVTVTVLGSNDPTADNTADTGWTDISTDILGAASFAVNNTSDDDIFMLDTNIKVARLMVKVVYAAGATPDNSCEIDILKAY